MTTQSSENKSRIANVETKVPVQQLKDKHKSSKREGSRTKNSTTKSKHLRFKLD